MKIYANVSSERATKGQGGNEYLEIEVLNEDKERIAYLAIRPVNGQTHLQFSLASADWRLSKYHPQGERFSMSGIIDEKTKCPFQIGDKVRFKNGDPITYTVYNVYDAQHVSLSLAGYPDVESDTQTNVKDIVKAETKGKRQKGDIDMDRFADIVDRNTTPEL